MHSPFQPKSVLQYYKHQLSWNVPSSGVNTDPDLSVVFDMI